MNEIDKGHWQFDGDIPTDALGFIYKITNKIDGRGYIGKKLLVFRTCKRPLKNNKNKRRGTKTSDWAVYTGSSNELNSDIEKLGKQNFKFEILFWCKNKLELSYYETKFIIDNNALFSNKYYNQYLWCRIRCSPNNKKN
jgi:hypothetical protein